VVCGGTRRVRRLCFSPGTPGTCTYWCARPASPPHVALSIRRIEDHPRITLRTRTEDQPRWKARATSIACAGAGRRGRDARNPPCLRDDGRRPPATRWVAGCIELGRPGFIRDRPAVKAVCGPKKLAAGPLAVAFFCSKTSIPAFSRWAMSAPAVSKRVRLGGGRRLHRRFIRASGAGRIATRRVRRGATEHRGRRSGLQQTCPARDEDQSRPIAQAAPLPVLLWWRMPDRDRKPGLPALCLVSRMPRSP